MLYSRAMQFSTESVRDLARLLNETGLHEISLQTVADDKTPLRLVVRGNVSYAAPRVAPFSTTTNETPNEISLPQTVLEMIDAAIDATSRELISIGANAVGLFRPLATPLQTGDEVRAGQVVAVVESLKIPNEVKSSTNGRVAEILVEDGQGVEYGQTLFVIDAVA